MGLVSNLPMIKEDQEQSNAEYESGSKVLAALLEFDTELAALDVNLEEECLSFPSR